MAYNAVSTTKNAVAALRYGEHEKSAIVGGVDCPPDTETAIKLFKADRLMWGKDSGIQAHILIQSFEGRECSPQEANEIGQELARRVAPGHRAMVYTHQEAQGGNVHNHIVICAVNHENGKKIDGHGLLYKSRAESNEICKEHGLSVIQEKKAKLRYTMAEQGIIDKGGKSWKNDIRAAVEDGLATCRSLDEFKDYLWNEYGIGIRERGSKQTASGLQWTFYKSHGGKEVKVRAARLGEFYTRENVLACMNMNANKALDAAESRQAYVCASLKDAAQIAGGEQKLFKAIADSEAWKKSIRGRSKIEKDKAKKHLKSMIKSGGKATVIVASEGGKLAASVIKVTASVLKNTLGAIPILGAPIKLASSAAEGAAEAAKNGVGRVEDAMVRKDEQRQRQRLQEQSQRKPEPEPEEKEKESGSAGSGSAPQMKNVDPLDELLRYTDYSMLSEMEKEEVRVKQVLSEV